MENVIPFKTNVKKALVFRDINIQRTKIIKGTILREINIMFADRAKTLIS